MRSWLRAGVGLFACSLMLAACTGEDPEAAKQRFLASGDKYVAEKNFSAAIVEYRNALEQDERFGPARFKLAQSYAAINDFERARREFVRAADLLPDNAEAQAAAGRALLRAGEFLDARARADRALKIDPKNLEAHLVRGSAAAGLRDLDGALQAFEEGLANTPEASQLHVSMATVQASQGRREEAEAAFKQALVVSPQSVPVRLALANYYWSTRQLAEAEATLNDAVRLENTNVAANRALATLYLSTKRRNEAEAPLKRSADASSDPQPKLVLADYYVSQARYDDAEAVLAGLADLPGATAAVMGRRAGIQYQRGRRDDAFALLDQVLAKEPKNTQLLILKGSWLLQEKKLPEALAAAKAAVDSDQQSWAAWELAGAVHAAQGTSAEAIKALVEVTRINPRALKANVLLAELHVTEKKMEAAVRYAEEAVQSHPTSGLARYALVHALIASGNAGRARTELQPLLPYAQNSAMVQTALGQLHLLNNEVKEARVAFDRALALQPSSAEALAGIMAIETAGKQPAQSVANVQGYLEKMPETAQRHYLAARTYSAAGDMQQAEASVRRAVAMDPGYIDAYHLLARLYIQQGRLDQAQQEYQRIAAQRPNDVSAHTMVALILQSQQKDAEAKKAYEKILSIDPRAVVASNNLAYLKAEEGVELDRALSLAQAAKATRPDHPDVNDTLGWVYYKRNLPTLAIDPLEQSVKADPGNPIYRLHLGLAYWKAGHKDKARTTLESALKISASFPGSDEARKVLAEIKG